MALTFDLAGRFGWDLVCEVVSEGGFLGYFQNYHYYTPCFSLFFFTLRIWDDSENSDSRKEIFRKQ